MEEIDCSVSAKSNILEQSYCEGVKKIAHQRRSNFFQLPKSVIEKRQNAWNKLFDKYDKKVDDYEIDMYESSSDVDNDDKDVEKESDENADDVDNKLYFVKNRTPIRKLPALVQYWIDTGNPPFQLNLEENDECESSFSEEPKSSPLITHTQPETEGKRDHSTSFLSSVDTAAYILSNTNVTKKADTLAIVEGAKKSDPPIEDNIILNTSKEHPSTNEMSNTPDKNNRTVASRRISDSFMNEAATNSHSLTTLDTNNMKNKKLISGKNCDKSLDKLIMETSVKITDILPTLKQLDKTINGYTSDNDELSNIISLRSHQKSTHSQPFSRKKLYTNRESPIDVIMSKPRNSFKPRFSTNISHPALQATPTINASKLYFRRRALRYSRKRKSGGSNKFKRLSNKSNLNSSKTKRSSPKYSDTESITPNDDISNDSMKNSIVANNDDQLKNNEKETDIVELCRKKNLVVELIRIPDDQLIKGNIQIKNIEQSLNLSKTVSVKAKKSNTRTLKNDGDILELDSQDSDQSTIIICECDDKKKALSQGETVIVDDDNCSDIFIGQFNKIANPSVLSEISTMSNVTDKISSNLDENKKTEVNVQSSSSRKSNNSENSEDQSWNLQLTFSSDEDDFTRMFRKKSEIGNIQDKSAKDANIIEPALINNKNVVNRVSTFGVIASSDDDEKEVIKVSNIFTQKRKSLRLYSRSKNVISASSDDESEKVEIGSKQKGKRKKSFSRKLNKHSNEANIKRISEHKKTRTRASHINLKLNYSESNSSSENITPLKKLRLTQNDTFNGNKKQAINDTNSTNEPIISLKEDFSLKKKNLNDLKEQDSTMKPDDMFQSKRPRRSNLKGKKDINVSQNGENENQGSPKKHVSIKNCSISIVKFSNSSEDVVDSGLSSIVSSNDRISKQTSNEKRTCSDELKSISTVESQNGNSYRSLRRKSNISTTTQRRSSKNVKKSIKKNKSSLVTNEGDSESDIAPRTQRHSVLNKLDSIDSMSVQKEQNFDTMFPDPIEGSDVLKITVFSSTSRRSRSGNAEKKHIDEDLSNSKLRKGKIKFHTGMCSDSD